MICNKTSDAVTDCHMALVIIVTHTTSIVTDVIQTRLIDHQDECVILTPDPNSRIGHSNHILSREQQLLVHMDPGDLRDVMSMISDPRDDALVCLLPDADPDE